ncbi:uncharacterized protein PG986_000602 [Apiospora aurea]|uniref:Uncharacterized protein n=1 Tax=Apiospora aurea TaxID=335848 RepID=A0ABR1QUF8_9PEZI
MQLASFMQGEAKTEREVSMDGRRARWEEGGGHRGWGRRNGRNGGPKKWALRRFPISLSSNPILLKWG